MPVLIKRYRNRRLYDTGRSAYITLDDLASDLAEGREVRIVDASSGADLTRRTMFQVLLSERHVHKLDYLPEEFLQTLLQLEDPSLMKLFGHYVGLTLSSFTVAQRAMQQNLELFKQIAPGPSVLVNNLARLVPGLKPKKTPEPKP
jgi:polyhydroxyalkanoate synthesis repressor PhaR